MDRTHQPSAVPYGSAGSSNERQQTAIYFAGLRLEADGSLFRGEAPVHLPPRETAALRLLLAHAGQIVTPAQLKRDLWGDVSVTPDSVPRLLSSLRAGLQPDDCIQTVYKRGYRLMAEVRQGEAALAAGLPKLAIPPFTTETGVPDYLASAIAEETIARLTNSPRPMAMVLARDSVFALARSGLTAQQIGESLHADLAMVGTLRCFTSFFRLRLEMIRIHDGVQIWVEDLLVERHKIAGLESDLASRIEFRLKSRPLNSPGKTPPAAEQAGPSPEAVDAAAFADLPLPQTPRHRQAHSLSIATAAEPAAETNPNPQHREAYDVFLRGRHEVQSMERHRMQDGMQHLSRAIELDPALIAAKIDLVHLCVTQAFFGYMPPSVAASLLYRTAESVPDLHLRAASILPSLGWVNFHVDHNLPAALRAFSLSAHLPHDTFTTRERCQFALSRHRFDEAISLLQNAIKDDPHSPWLQARLGWTFHLAGRAQESMETLRRALTLYPEHDGVAFYGSIVFASNGETAEGLRLAEEVSARQPNIDLLKAVRAYALACVDRKQEASTILEGLLWMGRERFVARAFIPAVHVALGDLDAAIHELNAANNDRCPWLFQMLADPRLRPLHGHPEFEKIRAILPRMEAAARAESDAGAGIHS